MPLEFFFTLENPHIPAVATTPGNNNASFLTFEFYLYEDDAFGAHIEKSCTWSVHAGDERNQLIGTKIVKEGNFIVGKRPLGSLLKGFNDFSKYIYVCLARATTSYKIVASTVTSILMTVCFC